MVQLALCDTFPGKTPPTDPQTHVHKSVRKSKTNQKNDIAKVQLSKSMSLLRPLKRAGATQKQLYHQSYLNMGNSSSQLADCLTSQRRLSQAARPPPLSSSDGQSTCPFLSFYHPPPSYPPQTHRALFLQPWGSTL